MFLTRRWVADRFSELGRGLSWLILHQREELMAAFDDLKASVEHLAALVTEHVAGEQARIDAAVAAALSQRDADFEALKGTADAAADELTGATSTDVPVV